MKTLVALTALLSLTPFALGQLADMIDLPEEMAEQQEPQFTDEELLQSWGWLLAERFNLKGLELSPGEVDMIAEGMIDHVLNREAPTDLKKSMIALQDYFAKREEEILARQLKRNKARELEFFDAMAGLPDVQALATGLHYQILKPGNDVRAGDRDIVVVHYEGRFLDNSVFDSTKGQAPAALKMNEVIDGWNQGVKLIGEGGKVKLYVPAKLGYGDEPRPKVPPGSTLVFEIELIRVGLPEGMEIGEEPQPEAAPVEGTE